MYAGRGNFHYLQCRGAEVLYSRRRCTRTGDSPLTPHLRDGDMLLKTAIAAVFSASPRAPVFFPHPLKTTKSPLLSIALIRSSPGKCRLNRRESPASLWDAPSSARRLLGITRFTRVQPPGYQSLNLVGYINQFFCKTGE